MMSILSLSLHLSVSLSLFVSRSLSLNPSSERSSYCNHVWTGPDALSVSVGLLAFYQQRTVWEKVRINLNL